MPTLVNGRLPDALLMPIPWARAKRLTAAAVADLAALNSAFRAVFGHDLVVNDAYRDLATQVAYKARTKLPAGDPRHLGSAAEPGTSMHGWGEAVDLGQLGGFHSDEYGWLLEHAPAFGWHHPPEYDEGTKHPEPWHWEHPSDTPVWQHAAPAAEEEDDVALTPEQARGLAQIPQLVDLVQQALTKARRHDLLFLYFSTPDHRPAIAQPGAGWWAIAPSLAVRDKQREIAKMLGLVVEGTSVKDWEDVVGQVHGTAPNGDVVLDPEGFIELRAWPFYPGGNLHP